MYVYFCDLLFFDIVLFESFIFLLYSFLNRPQLIHSVDGPLDFVCFVFAIANNAAMNTVYLRGTMLGHVIQIFSFTR